MYDNNENPQMNNQQENYGEMFGYFRIGENNLLNNDNEQGFNNNRSRNRIIEENNQNETHVSSKFCYTMIRLLFLGFFYFIEKNPLTPMLLRLIEFLLFPEALVVSNYILMKLSMLFYACFHREEPFFPKYCLIFSIMNDCILFAWFLYGNILLLTDKMGVEESIRQNTLLTYYMSILILIGYFIFAKIIFYTLFFITFCPCIVYLLLKDLHNGYIISQKAKRLQEKLKPINFQDYLIDHGNENDLCVICHDNFKEDDKVVVLPCNIKHLYHSECIYAWIKKKPICPLCKKEIAEE